MGLLTTNQENARKTMREVSYQFVKGEITPLLDKKWLRRFEGQLKIFEPDKIRRMIRRSLEYSEKDLKPSKANQVQRQLFFQKLEVMMDSIEATTKGLRRASGNEESSHSLRAILHAVMLDMPDQGVYTAGAHDFGEYVQNGIPLIVPYKKEVRRFSTFSSAIDFIMWMWGTDTAKDVEILTRKKEDAARLDWSWAYMKYLVGVRRRIYADLGKKIDATINALELSCIEDDKLREEKIRNSVLKIAWQVPWAQRYSFIIAGILLAAIERQTQNTQYDYLSEKLKIFSRSDLEKYRAGFSLCSQRSFEVRTLKQAGISGSPVLNIYGTGPNFEIEVPFADQIRASEIITGVLGGEVKELRVVQSLLPYNLTYASIFSLSISRERLLKSIPALVQEYRRVLRENKIIKGFDANEWADAAEEKNEARMKKVVEAARKVIAAQGGKGTPPQENGAGQGPPALQASGKGASRLSALLSDTASLFFGGPPLAEGPI